MARSWSTPIAPGERHYAACRVGQISMSTDTVLVEASAAQQLLTGQLVAPTHQQATVIDANSFNSHWTNSLVCIDCRYSQGARGFPMVVTFHYMTYVQAFPTKDQKSSPVTKVLYFVYYGLPARTHSDQGRDFESRLIKELLAILGI